MQHRMYVLILLSVGLSSCASTRLSHDDARMKIAAIGRSSLIPGAIEIRRIVSQTEREAIAESTVALAFHFKRDNAESEWKVAAVRLGDRDWISLDELLAAINEGRRRSTTDAMQKIVDGVVKYRTANGSLPAAEDIVGLTDVLHPNYMSELVRDDAWGQPIVYEKSGSTAFRLLSMGADGRQGTPDDVILETNPPATP